MGEDRNDLQRFVAAQAESFETALSELKAGQKRSHWMWFIFPQMRGLGLSPTADFYGIASIDEARDYLDHPVLGPRLATATDAVLATQGRSPQQIFGSPDDLKFRSSMTLFALAAGRSDTPFSKALERWFDGQADAATLHLLETAD